MASNGSTGCEYFDQSGGTVCLILLIEDCRFKIFDIRFLQIIKQYLIEYLLFNLVIGPDCYYGRDISFQDRIFVCKS